MDGWSDLLDDMSDKAPALTREFQQRMAIRQSPNIHLESSELTPGGFTSEIRAYQLATTRTGATLAVRIGKFGRDLYLSWDLWVRPVPNWPVILAVLGIAALLASTTARTPGLFGPPTFNVLLWIAGTISHFLWIGFLVALAGRVLQGSWLWFFIKQLTPFDLDDITAMQFAVHNSLRHAADIVGIDRQLLRPKPEFHGGQPNRVI